ncbi:MAG: phage major capsid protein [Verrucomicrobiota bacterium]
MLKFHFSILAVALLFPISASVLHAADAPTAETKLREALRNTMLQLRTVETERANLQTTQAEADQKNKDLTARVDALVKQAGEDKKSLDELNAKISDQDSALARLKADFGKSQDSLKKAADMARTKEAERAKLAGDIILLQRHVADLETRNMALFKLGNEILSRYESFGLGTALTAREPFTGLTRTKLENLVQTYQDKLSDQTLAAADEKTGGQPAKSSPDKKQKTGDPAGNKKP